MTHTEPKNRRYGFKYSISISLILIIVSEGCVLSQLIPLRYRTLSEDGKLTYPELAEKYGHPATTHEVITDDGYILTLYRLPGDSKRPVLLIHGNTPTSDCWIARGYTSLAITLAQLRYDVWAINLRGTRYSRKHMTLDPDTQSKQFFNYSFYEEAIYDVPATIDFILKETGEKALIAIGHSVGTTLLYVMGAEKPIYNGKIKLGVSLSPISFLQHNRGTLYVAKHFGLGFLTFLSVLGFDEVFTHTGIGSFFRVFCFQPLGYKWCLYGIAFPLMGYDSDGFEPEFGATFFGHFPGGTTIKILKHLMQIIDTDKFAKFDYGKEINLKEYGSPEPPEFDLNKVTMPTALILGENDFLGTVKDGERLNMSLPNVVHYQVLPNKKFNHLDFVWGRHMNETLYPYLLDLLRRYE